MATQVKHRRGANSEILAGTPAIAELWFNTTDNSIHMGDGVTQGGIKHVTVDMTDLVYKFSGSKSAVDNMVDGVPVSARIGDICSTGQSTWKRVTDTNGDITDFKPLGEVFLSDFKDPDGSDFTEIFTLVNSLNAPIALTYGVYGVYDVDINVPMTGYGLPTVKSLWTDSINVQNGFKVESASGIKIKGVKFDGNVSDDPVEWDSLNYDSFTGAIPLHVKNSTSVTFENCQFNNANWSGFKAIQCTDLTLIDCKSNRTRGNFGDGYYVRESSDVKFFGCNAYDHTRIGFVCEAGCFDVRYSICTSKYGHDQSASYGGTEWNRGFWMENSSDCNLVLCLSENQWSGGFVCTTTVDYVVPDREHFSYSLFGCISKDVVLPAGKSGGAEAGFRMSSLGGVGAIYTVTGCRSYNSEQAFNSIGQRSDDIYNYKGCYGEVRGESVSSVVFFNDTGSDQTNESIINVIDCSGKLLDTTYKYDIDKSAGDFGGFSSVKNTLNIVGYKNLDDGVCTIKNQDKADSVLSVEGRPGCETYWMYLNSTNLNTTLRNLTLAGPTFNKIGKGDSGGVAELSINDVTMEQELRATDNKLSGKGNRVTTGQLRHDIISYPLPANNLFNVDVDIEADISATTDYSDSPVTLRYASGHPKPIIAGVWKNIGDSVTGNKGFVGFGTSQVTVYANGVVSDDTVEFQVTDGFGGPTPYNFTVGSQIISM